MGNGLGSSPKTGLIFPLTPVSAKIFLTEAPVAYMPLFVSNIIFSPSFALPYSLAPLFIHMPSVPLPITPICTRLKAGLGGFGDIPKSSVNLICILSFRRLYSFLLSSICIKNISASRRPISLLFSSGLHHGR